MGFFKLFLGSCRKQVGRLFNAGAKAAKVTKAASKAPIPVGQAVKSAQATKPAGFFERLAQLHADPNYQAYKEVFNKGIPFDHYLYMH